MFAGIDSPVATLYALYCWTTVPSRPRWLWTCNTHNLHVASIEHTTIFEIEAGFACCFDGAPQNEPRCRPKHTVERLETYIRLSANPWTLTQTTHGASPIPRNLSKEKVLAAYDISHAGSWQAYCRQPSSQVNNSSTSATSEITSLFFADCPLRSFRSMGTNRWCCYSRYAVS